MTDWTQDLHTTALVGTGRRPVAAEFSLASIGVTAPQQRDAQQALLDQAALADALARGGQVASTGTPIAPAPAETLPEAPAAASQLLDLLLHQAPVPAEQKIDLIVLWLTTAREHGTRVSPALLPDLFDLAANQRPVRGLLPAVWGQRGAWLARALGLEASLGGSVGPVVGGGRGEAGQPQGAGAPVGNPNDAADGATAGEYRGTPAVDGPTTTLTAAGNEQPQGTGETAGATSPNLDQAATSRTQPGQSRATNEATDEPLRGADGAASDHTVRSTSADHDRSTDWAGDGQAPDHEAAQNERPQTDETLGPATTDPGGPTTTGPSGPIADVPQANSPRPHPPTRLSPEDAAAFEAFRADWPTLTPSTAAERLMQLRQLDPDEARELLIERWATLPARERNDLLGTLGLKLSLSDEPLLEQSLDDKAKSVRETAQRLLSDLPGSQLRARMGARLAPLIQHHKGLLKSSLELALPPDPDAAAIRDGLPAPAKGAEPNRVHWLRTLVRHSPLTTWTQTTGLAPAKIVDLLAKDSAQIWLHTAITTEEDPDFGRALFRATGDVSLLGLLDDTERQTWLLDQLSGTTNGEVVANGLHRLDTPWPEPIALAVLGRVERNSPEDILSWSLPRMLADGLPASVLPRARQVAERLGQPSPQGEQTQQDPQAQKRQQAANRYRTALHSSIQHNSFRQSIQEAFR